MSEIPKAYNPQEVEDKIYKEWEESGKFNPDNLELSEKAEVFSVAMPPPNVTGILHLGHALENTLMDTMVRYQRMRGKKALLVPGTDHAAVATQAKVEKDLVKSGKYKNPREELGREKLLEIIRDYAENSKATILSQIRKMGTSCDWNRLAYTFDEPRSRAVNEVFVKMYRDGLIYRGYRVVNWSVKGQSTCSDDELVYVERPAKLYTFRYSKNFPISIATTRPETKLGDTAVAVHPDDERYKKYIGKIFTIDVGSAKPLRIKVVADESIDRNFGTGAVGITPAHSMIDYDLYIKHKLELVQVIGNDGKMIENAGADYQNLTVEEAREKFVKYLKGKDLIEKEEDIIQNVGASDRFGDVVEVLPMTQWFVDVNKKIHSKNKSLKDLMREAATIGHDGDEKQKIKITPDRFEKVYLNWIDNLRDWCISRQVWWGHRIPVYYDLEVKENENGRVFFTKNPKYSIFATKEQIQQLEKEKKGPIGYHGNTIIFISFNLLAFAIKNSIIKSDGIKSSIEKIDASNCKKFRILTNEKDKIELEIQDPDTLDTWFSSGLWTFSTLGWPDETKDFKTFHPTTWMQMGSEIVFFWMARMILMSTYAIDQIPFKDVYIHGILRDKNGRKFSKSLGNGIDPLDIMEKYGTDALRLSLITGTTPGNDMRFYEEKVEGYRNLVNKLWNISRYVIISSKFSRKLSGQSSKQIHDLDINENKLSLADKWILNELNDLIMFSTENLEKYNFSLVGEALYEFTWSKLADWYIEISKVEKDKDEILLYILEKILILWHPFMPFATEEIWSKFKHTPDPSQEVNNLLMIEKWPEQFENFQNEENIKKDFELVKDIVTSIRTLRSENKIEPKKKINAIIVAKDKKELIGEMSQIVKSLARLENLTISDDNKNKKDYIYAIVHGVEIYILRENIVDENKEKENLKKEIDKTRKYSDAIEKKLKNENFMSNAPAEIVEKEKNKLKVCQEKLEKLKEKLETLS